MDATVIRFTTTLFDVTKERPNPINPIRGESLLLWFAEKLKGQVAVPEPRTEDWGWYVDIDWDGRAYMLGTSASALDDDETSGGPCEWILQVVKQRTFKERLLGREKMTSDDACAAYLRRLLESEPAFADVTCD